MKNIKKTILFICHFLSIWLFFRYFLAKKMYIYLTHAPKIPYNSSELIFMDSLKRKSNHIKEIYRIPSTYRELDRGENLYLFGISYNYFPDYSKKIDSLEKTALSISKYSFFKINKMDTTIYKNYGVKFWCKQPVEFQFTIQQLIDKK